MARRTRAFRCIFQPEDAAVHEVKHDAPDADPDRLPYSHPALFWRSTDGLNSSFREARGSALALKRQADVERWVVLLDVSAGEYLIGGEHRRQRPVCTLSSVEYAGIREQASGRLQRRKPRCGSSARRATVVSKKKDTAAKTGVAEYASGGAHVLTQVEIEGPKRARALTSPLPHTNCHLAVVPGHKSESIVAQAGVKSSAIEQGGRAEIARTLEADGSASQGGERDDSWRGVLSSPQLGAWGKGTEYRLEGVVRPAACGADGSPSMTERARRTGELLVMCGRWEVVPAASRCRERAGFAAESSAATSFAEGQPAAPSVVWLTRMLRRLSSDNLRRMTNWPRWPSASRGIAQHVCTNAPGPWALHVG